VISVITPVYNVKAYLAEAVESVIHQTYQDLEIILVDDGSTDGSGEICDEYAKKDNRIKVIHQQNKGLSAARNAGLDACQGEIISFLDSDDVFRKDMLEKMHDAMEKTRADIVECGILRNDGGRFKKQSDSVDSRKRINEKSDRLEVYNTREALHQKLRGKIKTVVWNKIYKYRIWDRLRFREDHNYEDLDIILPLLSRALTVCRIDEYLAIRRIREGSITQTNTEKNVADKFQAYQHYVSYVETNIPCLFDQEDICLALRRGYPGLLRIYFRCVSLDKAAREKNEGMIKSLIADSWRRIDHGKCGIKTPIATILIFCFHHF